MKSFFISILLTGMFLYANAQDPAYPPAPAALQNIIAAEYFVDTDPGAGAAVAIPVSAAVNISNLPATVNTSGLANGFHRLFLRTKNLQGVWGMVGTRDFIYDFNPAYKIINPAQNIIAAEYFIDTDPGFGAATPISITAGVNITNIPVTVNTAGLSNGLHHLFIRSKNNEGSWSLVTIKDFLYDLNFPYPTVPVAPQNIIAAEYFINTDPGIGNGTAIVITPGVDITNIPVIVNTAALAPATTNHLFIRTKNNEGRWSVVNYKVFVKDITNDPPYAGVPAAAQDIIAAEYFINTDPGPGNGMVINITPGLDISNIPVVVNTSGLQPSTTNQLFIRTKNNEGRWSISNSKVFVVDITNDPAYPPVPATIQNITAAEYFINTDPGAGNAIPVAITAATDISNVPVVVNTAALQPATTNHLFLRTKNNEGRWSITNIKQFAVTITNDPVYTIAPAAPQNITAAEYFIDTDPGVGSGNSITITPALSINNLAVSVNTTGLSNGLHRLFIRSKNNEGRWSITNTAAFYTDLLSLNTDSLLYGNVPVNTTLSKDLIITNNSAVNQTINAVIISAPYTSDFTTAITIAAGMKDTIKVNFNPTVAGDFIQGLQLQTSSGNYNVGLRGTGVTQVPSWTLSPATGHNYGNVALGSSNNFAFNIQNTGNIPVTLSNVTATNTAFVPSFAAGTIIPVNGNISLQVLFTPGAVGPYTAQLKIESSTPGVSFVTTTLNGAGYNPGAAPVLQFVAATPYNSNTGVNPVAGNIGDYTYKILYRSTNNRAPQTGSPKVSVDLNGDQDFTDLNEGTFVMAKETAGNDYVTGIVYSYTYSHLANNNNAGYKFSATDDNGNTATSINTGYLSGPVITDQQLDLRIFANDISFSKNNPLPGETFTVFARVSNSTGLPATNIPVKFYRDTILIGSDVIPAVNAFSNATISRTLSFAAEGFYPIKVWIDSSNTLSDINPLNNYAIRPVVVGSPNLPGGIALSTNATMQQCPQVKVFISGYANYYGTGSPAAVAGAEVTINTGTQIITTTTNSNGYYSYLLASVTCGSNFTYTASITDFTFTSNLVTHSISLPCPPASACVPPPSMGGMLGTSNTNPCANIVGSNGSVSFKLKYRERNLANFWNSWDQIIKDTLKIYRDGVLIETIVSADYTHAPGNEVIIPVNVPLTSTTATSITAELKYIYIEYFEIPSSYYHGNYNAMSHTGGVTINPVAAQPDLTIQGFAQTGFTSFSFNNANIKCVAAGPHSVKIFDSIPGGTLTLIDTRNFSSLSAGGTAGINYSNNNFSSGIHFIRVITDSEETVSETNEGNNSFSFMITVPPSELTVTKISTSPTDLSIGSSTRFTASIRNTGRRTGSFNVRFRVNGVPVGALKNITSLNENSITTVISDAYVVANNSNDCGAVVEAFADVNNQVVESNETNNNREIILGADLAPYQIPGEPGSASNPVVVRVFTSNQFFPAVRNVGHRDANDVTARFNLNNNWIGADTIGHVKAGEIYAAHVSFSRTFTTAGNYVVKVLADTANLTCEENETNNEGDFHIRVVDSKPDLEVLSQYISPSSLNPNVAQAITLVGTVKNRGGQSTTATVLRFLVDDIQLGADVPINALLPGRDTTVAATVTYSSIIPGVKIMKIITDPANTIIEEREDNNEATRTMIVGDAPDMARSFAGAISFNPSGFVEGDSVTVNFIIKNQGVQDGTAWVKFFIKDTTYATTALDSMSFSLAAGATATLSRRMLFSVDEGFVTTEIYNSSPMEFDLLNNNDTLHFSTIAKMKQSITINGNLDMKMAAPAQLPEWIGGKIMLGNYDLTVNGIILHYDSAHFIISNGTGKLKLVNSNPENIYPIGSSDTSMNFVRLNNSGTADNFSVRVGDYVLRNGASGDTVQISHVDRTWFIEEDVPGGSNAAAEFWWSTTHELPGFARQISRTAHYTSQWEYGIVGAAILNTNGQYSRTQAGFTSFSPFTITSSTGTVPLTLLSFDAVNKPANVLLNWKTTNEINTAFFLVERSADGIHFSSIGNVAANNTSGIHLYDLEDRQPLDGISYYRLKQTDIGGIFTYSDIVAINRNNAQISMTVFPNPVTDIVNVVFAPSEQPRKLLITDSKGAVVKMITVPARSTTIQTNMGAFAKGLYSISLTDGKNRLVQRVMKQ
ncbi:MAG: choice-of-anchor D domain-containing protein [Rhizobacter sp.]|nr:choice-of-anchor D domain-containing protein [Ferruginibacter sp.]